MGSKKHKKESKKKKHRSKSRSPLEGEERERKRHRKHKDRKRDRSPDVEEVPVDSHLQKNEESERMRSRSRSVSAERDRRMRDQHRDQHRAHRDASDGLRDKSYELEREIEKSPVDVAPKSQESLSVEETNRLRAKLGLKPLEVAEKPADDGKFKDDLGEFYHKPAVNIAQQKKTEKLKEKLEQRKEKRKLEKKLQTTLLAEESDDEDAIAWVQRSRDIEKQKREAAKRAAMLDEMDEVFGVSALVAEEVKTSNQNSYQPKDLQGLRVAHDIDTLGDERETVLTLADKEVLADDDEDVLVNVNIVDNEKYKKNIEERRKARAGYQAYDEEAELEASLGFQRPVLSKYDELIDQDKPLRTRGFRIGDDDAIEAKKFRDLMRQERRAGGADKRLESLQLPELRIASDYMDEHELQAKFKKPKKKGKMRKKQKEEPIDVDDYDEGLVPLDTDDTEVNLEQLKSSLAMDEEETEPDTELQAALARARRLRQLELAEQKLPQIPKVEEILERVKEENTEEGEEQIGAMVFDATAEFCRTLGDIPTYGLAGNREHTAQPMEEDELDVKANGDADMDMSSEANAGAWSRVDVHTDKQPDLTAGSSVALDAEPALGCGVGGALQLALSKGYLERPGAGAGAGGAGAGGAGAGAAGARNPDHRLVTALAARHYSIEDKTYGGEDDKYGRRERGHSGPLQDFREKQNFRPSIKLEYVDDEGRPLRPKEAFRYLSHKFHGKGPGKNKQEKRIKKAIQEGLMKKMSSTDTPLGTLQMLQEKQRETHSPFILLSGAKRDPNN